MNKRYIFIALACFCALAAGMLAFLMQESMEGVSGSREAYTLYIDYDDTPDSVRMKSRIGWRWRVFNMAMKYKVRTGCYTIEPSARCLHTYRLLRNGIQTPVRLTIPTTRTMDKMAQRLSEKLMLDSAEIANALTDSLFYGEYGYTKETLPALFIPDTYEVYWDISMSALMKRMVSENKRFWNKERCQKAESLRLTHEEVATLASIVDEETANDAEKPMIAGMYLNRLNIGMPLQADPTVKFALGDFALRRIYNEHLKVDNPYNTYRNTGLPPGPIRVASKAGLEAVLNRVEHPYLYMCAKEDFSGTHNFAVTYSDHLKNAARYVRALNERKIR